MPLDSRTRAAAGPVDVVRSIAFYLVFYLGSIPYVVGAALAMLVSDPLFRTIARAWSAFHRGCARWIAGIELRIEGETSPTPVIYALRHESFFEAIDLPHFLYDPVVVAKAELMKIPVWGLTARRWGCIAVNREEGAKALRNMVREARVLTGEGRSLAIFPEGTRVRSGEGAPLQSGFAALYKLLGMPVVPIALDSGRLYHRWFKRAGIITYRFCEPIPPGLSRDEIEARVHAAINVFNREGGEAA